MPPRSCFPGSCFFCGCHQSETKENHVSWAAVFTFGVAHRILEWWRLSAWLAQPEAAAGRCLCVGANRKGPAFFNNRYERSHLEQLSNEGKNILNRFELQYSAAEDHCVSTQHFPAVNPQMWPKCTFSSFGFCTQHFSSFSSFLQGAREISPNHQPLLPFPDGKRSTEWVLKKWRSRKGHLYYSVILSFPLSY